MVSTTRQEFIKRLTEAFGRPLRVGKGSSLFELPGKVRVYVRYSKVHQRGTAFFGLRNEDLALLAGFRSFIAFLWDEQALPLLMPYEQVAVALAVTSPATDGQYKAHVHQSAEGTTLRLARAGRMGVDAHLGFGALTAAVRTETDSEILPALSHHQVQSILSWIGSTTGHAVYTPRPDRGYLDSGLLGDCRLVDELPASWTTPSAPSLGMIDVLWLHPSMHTLAAAFEVEHSTPIYSGLLRFNDVHLDCKLPRAGIVAEFERADAFYRQIARRTFRASGLDEVCLFYSYSDVYAWYTRLRSGGSPNAVRQTPESPVTE
jgi:hypothetical protein